MQNSPREAHYYGVGRFFGLGGEMRPSQIQIEITDNHIEEARLPDNTVLER